MEDSPPASWRGRKPPPPRNSDIYSTFLIHDKDDSSSREPDPDMYATMVYKDGGDEDTDEEKDASISGTMVVKTNRRRSSQPERNIKVAWQPTRPQSAAPTSYWGRRSNRSEIEDEEESSDNFSTFVVRGGEDEEEMEEEEEEEEEEDMGTMVRRGGGGGTMRMAVESMLKAGEIGAMGHGKGRKSSGDGGGEGYGGTAKRKVSSSPIPEYITREDPSSKYELLSELGKY